MELRTPARPKFGIVSILPSVFSRGSACLGIFGRWVTYPRNAFNQSTRWSCLAPNSQNQVCDCRENAMPPWGDSSRAERQGSRHENSILRRRKSRSENNEFLAPNRVKKCIGCAVLRSSGERGSPPPTRPSTVLRLWRQRCTERNDPAAQVELGRTAFSNRRGTSPKSWMARARSVPLSL